MSNLPSLLDFSYEARNVRVHMDDQGEPWFVAKDVCEIIDLQYASQAVESLDADERGVAKVHTLGGPQEMLTISESGLYTLIMRSNKPEAKRFSKWVRSEVLPSIRKHGGYVHPSAERDAAMTAISFTRYVELLETENRSLKALETENQFLRAASGIGRRRRSYRTSDARMNYGLELATQGTPIADVAEEIGVCRATIYRWLTKMAKRVH